MSSDLDVTHWGGRHGDSPAIVATSAWNGLGFDPYQIWAFRRAELTPFVDSPFKVPSGLRATMGRIRTLDPRMHGSTRLASIGSTLLDDLAPTLGALGRGAGVALVLCLPERMGDQATSRFRAQRDHLERTLSMQIETHGLRVVPRSEPRGHAAFGIAIREAGLAVMSGAIDAAVVGGLDTYHDPPVFQRLLDERRLMDGENLDSFVPGEGGAFVVLARRDVARSAGWPLLARLESVALNREMATIDNDVPNLALGLSRAARAIADRLVAEKRMLDWWMTDVTAEDFRVMELQLAWPRAAHGVMNEHGTMDFLYPNLGDLGAATMPTGVVIAVEGFLRDDPIAARTCLVTGSSNGEERAAVLVARNESTS